MTPSERRTAELAAQGLSNREIASQTGWTEGAVKQTLHRVYSREGIESRVQLAILMRGKDSNFSY